MQRAGDPSQQRGPEGGAATGAGARGGGGAGAIERTTAGARTGVGRRGAEAATPMTSRRGAAGVSSRVLGLGALAITIEQVPQRSSEPRTATRARAPEGPACFVGAAHVGPGRGL